MSKPHAYSTQTQPGKSTIQRRWYIGGTVVIAVALLLWFALWLRPTRNDTVANIAEAGTAGTQVGDIAPDFTVSTINGSTFTLAKGQGKPTIMLFMAYWCGTCLGEARALTQLQQEYGGQLNIVAIDVDPSSTPELLGQFKAAAGDGNYIWAFDTGQIVTTTYEVTSLDTTLILDPQGRVVYRDQYPTPYQPLKDELVKLGL